jgi:prolipoprotein diacylglyceryltransferase
MKRKIFIIPLSLMLIVLTYTVYIIAVALSCETPTNIVGFGGLYPYAFKNIFGIPPYWFAIFTGVIITVFLAAVRRKQYGFTVLQTVILAIFFAIQTIMGTKLLFGLERVISGQSFSLNGLSLFGGYYSTIILTPIIAKILKKRSALIFDFVAPLGMTIISAARLGCYFARCCGAEIRIINGRPFYIPIQLFEVILDLSVLAFILYIEQNKLTWEDKTNTENFYNGSLALFILTAYGTYRFILEIWRDTPKVHLGMSTGQVFALICLIISATILIMRKRKFALSTEKNKQNHPDKRAKSK